jgi:hypothetical protein
MGSLGVFRGPIMNLKRTLGAPSRYHWGPHQDQLGPLGGSIGAHLQTLGSPIRAFRGPLCPLGDLGPLGALRPLGAVTGPHEAILRGPNQGP